MDFDPDAYLASKEKSAPAGFDPDAYLAGKSAPAKPDGLAVAASRAESIGHGIKDPITGGAQLLAHLLPEKAVEAGNELNNWLAKYGVVAPIPTKNAAGQQVHGAAALDEQIKQDESGLKAGRDAAGRGDGSDWFRLAGNVVSPANLAIAAKAPAAAGLTGKVLSGVGQGAASGALTPVTNGDFASEKAKQVATGAVTGGVVPVGTAAIARIIKPITSESAALLKKAGVTMTPGQILGGWAGRIEEGLTSIAGVGDAIKGAQRRGIVDFNNAAINDSIKPLGKALPKGVEGADAVKYARETLGDAYDTLLPKLKGDLNATVGDGIRFSDHLENIKKLGKSSVELSAKQKKILEDTINTDIRGKFEKSGLASGDTVKKIQTVLREKVERYQISSDPGDQALAGSFKEMGSALRSMLDDANPKFKDELSKINTGYAFFKRAQRASAGVGTQGEFFTPAQYNNAVKALDRSKDKAAFSEHRALGQQLADAGKEALSQKIPNSGTADRTWLQSPGKFMMGLAAGVPAELAYSKLGTQMAQAALMSRPKGADALANFVKNNTKAVTGGAVPLAELLMMTKGQ